MIIQQEHPDRGRLGCVVHVGECYRSAGTMTMGHVA
jgi:hypothetical protein